jgi:hypothetical protein
MGRRACYASGNLATGLALMFGLTATGSFFPASFYQTGLRNLA